MQRWNKSLIPTIVKGKWSKVEDALLVHLVNSSSSGEKDWAEISTKIPGRTSNAVKVQLKSLQRKRKRQPKHRDASATSE